MHGDNNIAAIKLHSNQKYIHLISILYNDSIENNYGIIKQKDDE
jgi:hypothetical protein